MYFSLRCVWGVLDEILGKIFVLFAIYSNVTSVWVISIRLERSGCGNTRNTIMKTSCTKRFASKENVQMLELIKTGTASVG